MPPQSVKDVYSRRIKLVLLKNSPADAFRTQEHVEKAGENLHEYYTSICQRYGETPQSRFELKPKEPVKKDVLVKELGGTRLPVDHIAKKDDDNHEKRGKRGVSSSPKATPPPRASPRRKPTENGLIAELFDILPASYGSYEDLFRHHGVDNEVLLSLRIEDLPSLGVSNPVHRKRIANALNSIQKVFKSEDPDAMMDFLVDHGLGLLTGPLTRMHLTSPELLLECEEADFARIGQNLPLALVLRLKVAVRKVRDSRKEKRSLTRKQSVQSKTFAKFAKEMQIMQNRIEVLEHRIEELESERGNDRDVQEDRSPQMYLPDSHRIPSPPEFGARFDSIVLSHAPSSSIRSPEIDEGSVAVKQEKKKKKKKSKFERIKEKSEELDWSDTQEKRQNFTIQKKRTRSQTSTGIAGLGITRIDVGNPNEQPSLRQDEPLTPLSVLDAENLTMDSAIESELTADMSNHPSLMSDMSMEPTSSDAGEMTTPTRRFKKSNRALIRASSSTPRIMSPEQKAKRDKAKFAFEAFMNELHEKSHGDGESSIHTKHVVTTKSEFHSVEIVTCIRSDGTYLYACHGTKTVRAYDSTGKSVAEIAFPKPVFTLCIHAGVLVAGGKTSIFITSNPLDEDIKIRKISLKKVGKGQTKCINQVTIHNNYVFVSDRGSKFFFAFDLEGKNSSPAKKYRFSEDVGPLAPCHQYIFASDSRGKTKMFDIEGELDVKTFRDNSNAKKLAVVSGGMYLWMLNSDGLVVEWDVQKGTKLREFVHHYSAFLVSPEDHSVILLGNNGVLHAMNLGEGKEQDEDEELLEVHDVLGLDWFDKSKGTFATWSRTKLQLYNVQKS